MACGCGGKRKERLAAKKVALTAQAAQQRQDEQFGPTRWSGRATDKEKTNA